MLHLVPNYLRVAKTVNSGKEVRGHVGKGDYWFYITSENNPSYRGQTRILESTLSLTNKTDLNVILWILFRLKKENFKN